MENLKSRFQFDRNKVRTKLCHKLQQITQQESRKSRLCLTVTHPLPATRYRQVLSRNHYAFLYYLFIVSLFN